MTAPVIGACVVPCDRCAHPIRVEVTAELSPIERPGWHSMWISRGTERVGTCWVRLRPAPVNHQCPPARCDTDRHPVTDLPCTRPSHTGVHTVDGDTWDTPDNEETNP